MRTPPPQKKKPIREEKLYLQCHKEKGKTEKHMCNGTLSIRVGSLNRLVVLKNRDCLGREMGVALKKGQCEGEPCDDDRSASYGSPHVIKWHPCQCRLAGFAAVSTQ